MSPPGWVGSAGILLSAGAHALLFVALGQFRVDEVVRRDDTVELSVVAEVPEPTPAVETVEPEPAPQSEPEPEPVKPAPKVRAAAPRPVSEPPPAPTSEPPAPAEETIADFSGTTLTGAGEGGWVSAVGSGAPMNGPIGKANAAVTGRVRAGVEGGAIGGTGLRVLSERDLSRRPQAPSQDILNQALERNYPRDAKQQGIEGVARIRVRVLASGRLDPLATLSETHPGFAEACKRSLRELRFEPPLDGTGQPVATDIPYTCTFTVE